MLCVSYAGISAPITYTFTGIATGTLGPATSFSNVAFTVTSQAETNAVVLVDSTYAVTAISSTFSYIDPLAGPQSLTFTHPMYWSVPLGSGDVVFGDFALNPSLFPGILGITALFSGLETYNLQSSFGPVFSGLDFPSSIFHTFQYIPTSRGALSLVAANDTFTASTAPEPAAVLLLGVGLASLIQYRRRTTPVSTVPISVG